MDIGTIVSQLLNGVQYGLLLFLIASGLTLVFGVLNIINLAHGSLFMIGAYTAFAASRFLGFSVTNISSTLTPNLSA